MMENRAYEDEANKLAALHQQHPHLHQHKHSQQPRPQEAVFPGRFANGQAHALPARFEPYSRGMAHPHQQQLQHSPDCHVYEDIVPPYGLEPGGGGFHRNLTLPLRRTSQSCESLEANPTSSSVRVTNKERGSVIERLTREERIREGSRDEGSLHSAGSSSSAERPARRRRKKDCKHCKSKACSEQQQQQQHRRDELAVYEERNAELRAIFGLPADIGVCRLAPPGCLGAGVVYAIGCNGTDCNGSIVNSGVESSTTTSTTTSTMPRFNHAQDGSFVDDKSLISPTKGCGGGRQAGMKVNSIYAQEHWHAKDPRIFLNDPKDQSCNSPFQRAYSAVSANSPSSENRANLRRSVRDEPAAHPARLRKQRHGWILQFCRPLGATTCTKSLVLLLIVVLALLGIGGIALYIVFEPEKLHVIQQYLRSSARNSSLGRNGSSSALNELDEPSGYYPTQLPTSSLLDALLTNASVTSLNSNRVPGNDEDSEPVFVTTWTSAPPPTTRTSTPGTTTTRSEPTSTSDSISSSSSATSDFLEAHRRRACTECRGDEVCVARNADETPYCRRPLDPQDASGCAGLCDAETQECHKLDNGAFRCTEIEHHCLDDEWTCLNIFCIPLVKRCDGQMNCYDHSDEYNCECNLETHFHCGNQTSCLPLSKKCDGHVDCFDATDEENCSTSHEFGRLCPSKDEYTCRNKQQCIRRQRFCDGYRDCKDGSDEPNGCQGRCNKHEFTCHNGRCINKADKCNGIDDCGDGSDEQHCRERL